MAYYNEQLAMLKEQVSRRAKLTSQWNLLQEKKVMLEERITVLEEDMADEQTDVERLEGRSLAAFFYRIIGKKGKMLSREKEEVYAAGVRLDAARKELEALKGDIRLLQEERLQLYGCEKKYEQLFAAKCAAIKESGNQEAEELLKLEEELVAATIREKEIKEALSAGNTALFMAQDVIKNLESAKGYGTWDMLGGGLIAGGLKHSHLEEAQNQVEKLQIQLSRFQAELTDVQVNMDSEVQIGGFMKFADYFYDGLLVDIAVINRIEKSLENMKSTHITLQTAVSKLEKMQADTIRRQEALKNRIRTHIANVSM